MIFKNIDRDRHEKYFLIIVIVFFSVNLLVNEVIRFAYGSASDLSLAPFAFQLLLGPAFYHYSKNSIVNGYRHKPVDIVMFLPFPVYVIFVICETALPDVFRQLIKEHVPDAISLHTSLNKKFFYIKNRRKQYERMKDASRYEPAFS